MEVRITARHFSLSPTQKTEVEHRVDKLKQYYDGITDVQVILDKVWGNEVVVGGRTIDVHIRKLREKIGEEHFKTVKGVGYKFVL